MADDERTTNPFESSDMHAGTTFETPTEEELPQGAPGVASRGGKAYVALVIIGLVVAGLLYTIFSGGSNDAPPEEKPVKVDIQPKDKDIAPPLPPEPKPEPEPPLPALPVIQPPQPVAPPESFQTIINPKDDSAEKAQALARMRSSMLVKDGGASAVGGTLLTNPPAAGGSATVAPGDANAAFAASAASSDVERVSAGRISNLRRTIAQGRIIQATLESAINTDLPAPIRAVVSVDTFGEAGTEPLIPKGSRLIGTYNTTLSSGQTRVFVVWTRVIRPDGVDVMLGSPLVDMIGQAGVAGQLDSKFQEIFARSVVSSVMNIAMAIGTDRIAGGETTTTTSTTGSQTSGDTVTTATTNALNRLGAMTDSFIQRFIQVPPTILVDQGTKVNVMVKKDIYFPEDTAGVRILN
jgi:type IV secretion system protein VirB10